MTPTQPASPLTVADLRELRSWAAGLVVDANGWAERAEASRGERADLTVHLDAIASRARHVASIVDVLVAR